MWCNVVQERGELLLPPLPCGIPHTLQRMGHAFPDLRPARALLARVPLGPRPSLHRLRRRLPGFVRQLRCSHEGRAGQGVCSGVRRHAQSFLSRFSIQGLSPVARPGGVASPCRSKLTYGRRSVSAAPTSRLRAVRTQGDVTSLLPGIESHAMNRFVHLGLPGMIRCPAIAFAFLSAIGSASLHDRPFDRNPRSHVFPQRDQQLPR